MAMQERALRRRLHRSSLGWEVVQLVGLQTLNLAILVRVQASQPKYLPSMDLLYFEALAPPPPIQKVS
jgi:hypothetical protein